MYSTPAMQDAEGSTPAVVYKVVVILYNHGVHLPSSRLITAALTRAGIDYKIYSYNSILEQSGLRCAIYPFSCATVKENVCKLGSMLRERVRVCVQLFKKH